MTRSRRRNSLNRNKIHHLSSSCCPGARFPNRSGPGAAIVYWIGWPLVVSCPSTCVLYCFTASGSGAYSSFSASA